MSVNPRSIRASLDISPEAGSSPSRISRHERASWKVTKTGTSFGGIFPRARPSSFSLPEAQPPHDRKPRRAGLDRLLGSDRNSFDGALSNLRPRGRPDRRFGMGGAGVSGLQQLALRAVPKSQPAAEGYGAHPHPGR